MFLTVNHLAFTAKSILSGESKTLIRWTDVTSVEKSNNLIAPDSICVSTREGDFQFGLFLGGQAAEEAYDIISQLANLAMRKLIDENATAETSVLNQVRERVGGGGGPGGGRRRNISRKTKNASALKRNLDANKICQEYRKALCIFYL